MRQPRRITEVRHRHRGSSDQIFVLQPGVDAASPTEAGRASITKRGLAAAHVDQCAERSCSQRKSHQPSALKEIEQYWVSKSTGTTYETDQKKATWSTSPDWNGDISRAIIRPRTRLTRKTTGKSSTSCATFPGSTRSASQQCARVLTKAIGKRLSVRIRGNRKPPTSCSPRQPNRPCKGSPAPKPQLRHKSRA